VKVKLALRFLVAKYIATIRATEKVNTTAGPSHILEVEERATAMVTNLTLPMG
jgi:hypothetical protein